MGWNSGYAIMEQQVISFYDKGLLTRDILNTLMTPFCNTDIDSGGSQDLKSQDGKSAEEIMCMIMEPEKYQKAIDDCINENGDLSDNEYLTDLWFEVSRKEWNLW